MTTTKKIFPQDNAQVPVFVMPDDDDYAEFLKDPTGKKKAEGLSEEDRATNKFYSALRFPDTVVDIPIW